MAYFALQSWTAAAPPWDEVLWWNLVPAGIDNIIGGGLGVAVLISWPYAGFVPLRT